MRKAKVVYLDGSQERELVIPPELLFDSEKKEKFIKDRIGNVDYTEYRYYDESDENFGSLPEQISDNSELINANAESVSELPPPISEVPDTSLADSEQPSIEVLTAEIKMYLHIANQSIIEVGKRLIMAKELVPYGEWQNWLKNNFNLKVRMAQNFMEISRRFSETHLNAFLDISTFNQTQLVELLTLPEGEEENFLALKAAEGTPAEDMTVKELRAEIKKYKEESEKFCSEAIHLNGKLNYAEEQLTIKQNIIKGMGQTSLLLDKQISELKAKLAQRPTVAPPDYEDLKRENQELRSRPVEVATEFPADYAPLKAKVEQLENREKNFKAVYATAQKVAQLFSIANTFSTTSENISASVAYLADENVEQLEESLNALGKLHTEICKSLAVWKRNNAPKMEETVTATSGEKFTTQQEAWNKLSKMALDKIGFATVIKKLLHEMGGYKKVADVPDDKISELMDQASTLYETFVSTPTKGEENVDISH